MIEGSGAGVGSIPLTTGSGSGRPKNMWIRIRNTDFFSHPGSLVHQKQKRRGENKEEGRKKGTEKIYKDLGV
jgi:hypothetical protein